MTIARNGSVSWHTRLDTSRPYQAVTPENDKVRIAFFPGNKANGFGFVISRADARLLARRINQCLDGTRK